MAQAPMTKTSFPKFYFEPSLGELGDERRPEYRSASPLPHTVIADFSPEPLEGQEWIQNEFTLERLARNFAAALFSN